MNPCTYDLGAGNYMELQPRTQQYKGVLGNWSTWLSRIFFWDGVVNKRAIPPIPPDQSPGLHGYGCISHGLGCRALLITWGVVHRTWFWSWRLDNWLCNGCSRQGRSGEGGGEVVVCWQFSPSALKEMAHVCENRMLTVPHQIRNICLRYTDLIRDIKF